MEDGHKMTDQEKLEEAGFNSVDEIIYAYNNSRVIINDLDFKGWVNKNPIVKISSIVDIVNRSMERSFILGKNFWAKADSPFLSEGKKSVEIHKDFKSMLSNVCGQINSICEFQLRNNTYVTKIMAAEAVMKFANGSDEIFVSNAIDAILE